jgi:hypothetical protein
MEKYLPTTEQTKNGGFIGVIMVTTDSGFSYNERLDITRLTREDAKLDAIAQIEDLKQLEQEGIL